MRLDRVYGRDVRIVRSFTDPSARAISDHLPVIADVTAVLPQGISVRSVPKRLRPPDRAANPV
jgi:hypothetical protein